jgi:hypothetical protein
VLSLAFFAWTAGRGPTPVAAVNLPTDGVSVHSPVVVRGAEPAKPGETPEQHAARACAQVKYDGPWRERLRPALESGCERTVLDNGRSLRQALARHVPRALFVFLPLLALAMKPLYWRPRHYYVEHLLLFVHNHACLFLVFTLYSVARAVLPHGMHAYLTWALVLYLPYYMYASLRQFYGQSPWLTLAKLAALTAAYVVSAATMLMATLVYSYLTA